MKIMKYMAVLLLTGLTAAGCNNDLDEIRVSGDPKAPVLNSRAPVVVDEDNVESDEQVVFTWERADYGYTDAAEYVLYGRIAGTEDEFERIESGYGDKMEIPVGDFNAAMLSIGVPAGDPVEVEMYLESRLSETFGILRSNTITVTVTAFSTEDYIYVPGSHQVNPDWDPESAPRLYAVSLRSYYEGCVNLVMADASAQPEFKFTHGSGWDKNWGGSFPALVFGGDNLTLPQGFYLFQFTFQDFGANEASATYIKIESIGIIGDSTPAGWDSETTMTQDTENPYLFKLTGVTMQPGEYKFRFNNDWDDSLGGSANNLTLDGGNASFTGSGSYDITLNMGVYPYQATFTEI